ncbi:MAG TPA: hypothetical protein PLJ78_09285 [Anaerolineae bacterium]|nr:hypothetical protein [Anaerolineae bacterium]HQK14120.1 hypothetical protein [Anaerolineae bacterium]
MSKRWRVIAIIILWIVLGVANLLRAGMAAYIAPALGGYPLSLPLAFSGIVYGVLGLIFLAAAMVAWRRESTDGAFGLAVAYQAILWALHFVGDRSSYARSLWLRDAVLTLLFLALIALLAGQGRLFNKKS